MVGSEPQRYWAKNAVCYTLRLTNSLGTRRELDHLPGPRHVTFNGPRFRVDKEKQFVTWMGWSFYLGFDRDMVRVETRSSESSPSQIK